MMQPVEGFERGRSELLSPNKQKVSTLPPTSFPQFFNDVDPYSGQDLRFYGGDRFASSLMHRQVNSVRQIVFGATAEAVSEATRPFRKQIAGAGLGAAIGNALSSRLYQGIIEGASILPGKAVLIGGGAAIGLLFGHGPSLLSDLYWTILGNFGYYRAPKEFNKIKPSSKKNPDGAIPYGDLILDPEDSSSIQIRGIMQSILAGNPLHNGIFYGDAGTGKSSVVQSFSHVPGYEVYAVSAGEMDFKAFENLTKWLKATAKNKRKILLDISEGERLLEKIALSDQFKEYFKTEYSSSQENYAIIFSCNYNYVVSAALEAISEDPAMARRMADRVKFSAPGPVVRVALLYRSVNKTLENKEFSREIGSHVFFEKAIFSDKNYLQEVVVPNTEGLSHDQLLTLGEKLVYLYFEAKKDEKEDLKTHLAKFSYLSENEEALKNPKPIDKLTQYLSNHKTETKWLKEQRTKEFHKSMDREAEDLPLLKLQLERRKLIQEIQSGDFSEAVKNP